MLMTLDEFNKLTKEPKRFSRGNYVFSGDAFTQGEIDEIREVFIERELFKESYQNLIKKIRQSKNK